jgi:hypothetical protein
MTLRDMVFQSLRNAQENGYTALPSDEAEAIDIMDTDIEVYEESCQLYGNIDGKAMDIITSYVAEWRAGAR